LELIEFIEGEFAVQERKEEAERMRQEGERKAAAASCPLGFDCWSHICTACTDDTTVFALCDLHYRKSRYFIIIAHTVGIFSKYITHLTVKGLYLVQCNG
jgi:hypothetical protein